MTLGKASSAYEAADNDRAAPVPDPLLDALSHVDDLEAHLEHAVSLVHEAAAQSANERGHDAPTAWEYLRQVCAQGDYPEETHYDLMRATIYKSKQDVAYWGVQDTSEERWCAQCREVKDLDEFRDERYRCRECEA